MNPGLKQNRDPSSSVTAKLDANAHKSGQPMPSSPPPLASPAEPAAAPSTEPRRRSPAVVVLLVVLLLIGGILFEELLGALVA